MGQKGSKCLGGLGPKRLEPSYYWYSTTESFCRAKRNSTDSNSLRVVWSRKVYYRLQKNSKLNSKNVQLKPLQFLELWLQVWAYILRTFSSILFLSGFRPQRVLLISHIGQSLSHSILFRYVEIMKRQYCKVKNFHNFFNRDVTIEGPG
jgi:hypothetical protein